MRPPRFRLANKGHAPAEARRHHVAVPRKELQGAKSHVARRIREDIGEGVKPADIDREALRFAGMRVRQLKPTKRSRPRRSSSD
jgi:hypothetical protein